MTRDQIISDFYKFRIKVWEKASSNDVRGHVEVWKKDSDLLEEVAGLLASLPQSGDRQ